MRIPRAGCEVAFAAGEPIWTESSYKYDVEDIATMVEAEGFRCHARWIEPEARFALTLFMVDDPPPSAP